MENTKKETVWIYYRESFLQSVASDLFMFLMLAGSMALNHFYFGDSGWWALILFIMLIMAVASKGKNKRKEFKDVASLKAFVNNLS